MSLSVEARHVPENLYVMTMNISQIHLILTGR